MLYKYLMKRLRRTKIVATVGPSSSSKAELVRLFKAGVDVFRLNFSHGTHEDHRDRVKILREIENEYQHPIGILADMQGPKFRIGSFKDGGVKLKQGQSFRFDLDANTPGDGQRIYLPHPEVIKALDKGAYILLDDGKVRAKVTKKGKDYLDTRIEAGQKLSDNKGFNIPGVIIPVSALTSKDRKDLQAALDMGVDWIAQSFVQKPEDVAEAKKLIDGRAGLIIKIEKPSAVEHLDEMLNLATGVMLARGDLGVEIPPEDVPSLQKRIVRKVRAEGKPIIVATQMLESMIENARPTRAEASDVATAVYDGTDAVMLSAETAAGKYPVEAVKIMDRICQSVETDDSYRHLMESNEVGTESNSSDAITASAYHVAKNIRATCIANFTTSGSTTLRMSRQRPSVPILCMTQNNDVAHRLTLSYGVHAVHVQDVNSFGEAVQKAVLIAKEQKLSKKGDRLVLTAGVPFGTPGSTNILRIAWVE